MAATHPSSTDSFTESDVSPSSSNHGFGVLARAEGHQWPCVVFTQRPDFRFEFASPNIKELTGLDAVEWCGQNGHFWDAVHESDVPNVREHFTRAAQSEIPVTFTYRIRHAHNGRVAYVMEHRHAVLSPEGDVLKYEAAWLDITRQTIAERRLAESAWKETLAILTMGMAHDFTNMIAGILSLSESFLSQMNGEHPFHEGISLIKKSSLQASELVKRMISLHLGQVGERNYHNFNDIVRDVMELVKKTLPRRVQLMAEVNEAQLPVYLDLVEFRQAVINLILNASDAMPRGGRLTVKTSRHDSLSVMENMKGSPPRLPCVCLSVQDTGTGIKSRYLSTIFDPFFTTKAKGSGLGLYNARLAVEKLHGAISVESTEGKGTTFKIWLPEADFSETTVSEDAAHHKRAARRSLLLIGPSGDLLDKTGEMLRTHNYYVVIASGSDRLPELLHSSDYEFDGVFILVEPMDLAIGPLSAEVRQQDKHVKLILRLTGGHRDDMDAQVLGNADLVLDSDLSETDFLAKLKTFFEQAG